MKGKITKKYVLTLVSSIIVGYIVRNGLIYYLDLTPSEILDCFLFGVPSGLSVLFVTNILEQSQSINYMMPAGGGNAGGTNTAANAGSSSGAGSGSASGAGASADLPSESASTSASTSYSATADSEIVAKIFKLSDEIREHHKDITYAQDMLNTNTMQQDESTLNDVQKVMKRDFEKVVREDGALLEKKSLERKEAAKLLFQLRERK